MSKVKNNGCLKSMLDFAILFERNSSFKIS